MKRLIYVVSAIAAAGLGLLLREPWLALPRTVAKYGGSALWAAMMYLAFRAVFARLPVFASAVTVGALAAGVELSQLISIGWFDEFRTTTLGALLFGRTFDWPDIAVYWAGIAMAAAADRLMQIASEGRTRSVFRSGSGMKESPGGGRGLGCFKGRAEAQGVLTGW